MNKAIHSVIDWRDPDEPLRDQVRDTTRQHMQRLTAAQLQGSRQAQ